MDKHTEKSVHGGDVYRNQVELDFSVNINPFGMPDGVKKALGDAIFLCTQYPDEKVSKLSEAMAKKLDVPQECILFGNGASELFVAIIHARKPKTVLVLAPSFSGYEHSAACEDCHMPYKSEGGVKFSDHHIQSPLAMIDRTCQTCHRESEETLRNNVYERQRKANEIRNRLEQELAKAHIEAKFAWDKGATEEQMKDVLALIRQAQWRWDFGVASHGGSFHAPQEIQRVLSHGLDRAMQARLAISKVLAKHGYTDNVPMPDISTKDKAQEYIGLDMDAERAAKDNFLKTTAPAWLEKAKANNRLALK